jgi:tetratricopeptide (TPR) repeat protein
MAYAVRDTGSGSLWARLKRWMWPSFEERVARSEARLLSLNETIERFPEASAGYVLRGEFYFEAGFYELARLDFRKALSLAAQQYATQDWGLVEQAMQDRARAGLERAQRHMARSSNN